MALAEGLLRVAEYPKVEKSGWRSGAPASELNQIGFRGRRIEYGPEDRVVVILSDSQGEARALPFDQLPEQRLEEHLNRLIPGRRTRVFTLGAGGYGNDQQLIVLEEYFQRYRADLVLLWQTPTNDIFNNMFPTHWPWNTTPKPTFWLENGGLAGPAQPMGKPVPCFRTAALLERVRPVDRDRAWERGHLPEPYRPLEKPDEPVDLYWENLRRGGAEIVSQERLDAEKSNFVMALKPRSPRTQYAIDLTHALLTRIRDRAARRGSSFVLVHYGVGREGEPVSPYIMDPVKDETVRALNGRFYRVSNTQFWENLREMNRGLPYVFVQITVKDWRVSVSDGHMNAVANEQVTRDLAALLLPFVTAARPAL